MTTYRFRVKYEHDPTSLWRDIVVGQNRALGEFQSTINRTVGLDQGHLWFFGTDQRYWQSPIRYAHSTEIEQTAGDVMSDDEEYRADDTKVGEMVRRMDLEEGDRICYLFDYGDEWRFYGILEDVTEDESGDRSPEAVNEKGERVDQYAPPGERL